MSLNSLETSESSLLAAKMHPWDIPFHNTVSWTLPPPMPLRRHPLPMIPQQQVRQVHSVFIELIYLLPLPLSPT